MKCFSPKLNATSVIFVKFDPFYMSNSDRSGLLQRHFAKWKLPTSFISEKMQAFPSDLIESPDESIFWPHNMELDQAVHIGVS